MNSNLNLGTLLSVALVDCAISFTTSINNEQEHKMTNKITPVTY